MNRKTGVGLTTLVVLIHTAFPAAAQEVVQRLENWMCAIDYAPPFPQELTDDTTFLTTDSELQCEPSGQMRIRCNGTLPLERRVALRFKNTKTYKNFPCLIKGSLCGFTDQLAGNSHVTVNGKSGVLKLHCNTTGPN